MQQTIGLFNQTSYKLDTKALLLAIKQLVKTLKMQNWELSITFVTKPVSKSINSKYLKHHYATDCLTFDLSEHKSAIGDIYICPAIAKSQAKTFKVSFDNEIKRLIIHTLLHLKGYDDTNPEAKKVMFAKQEMLLKGLKG